MQPSSPHSFHIPVMGLAYTIDTPIKVAQFGISSVISIIEDNLVEKMREHYYPLTGKQYTPITISENDYRARRITDYLNLVNQIVNQKLADLKKSSFEAGSDLNKYFEMLPNNSDLRRIFELMTDLRDPEDIQQLEYWLKAHIQPGSIDVNIMTKLDKNNHDKIGNVIENGSDAVVALRGYANSNLTNSSVILSAGMNPFYENLINGISYYRNLSHKINEEFAELGSKINQNLNEVEKHLTELLADYMAKVSY